MFKNKHRAAILAIALPLLSASAAPPPTLEAGRRILSNLRETRYDHRQAIDETRGIYRLDCSALACLILSSSAPESLAAVPVDPRHSHARAKNFCNTFLRAPTDRPRNGWLRVRRVIDARPGDFIAWKKDPMPPKGNTGHIVMVLERPVREADGTVRVRVLDASSGRHANDSRKKGETGIGTGTLWFGVDGSGAPVSVYWSSRKRPPVRCPIAIGRPAPGN